MSEAALKLKLFFLAILKKRKNLKHAKTPADAENDSSQAPEQEKIRTPRRERRKVLTKKRNVRNSHHVVHVNHLDRKKRRMLKHKPEKKKSLRSEVR